MSETKGRINNKTSIGSGAVGVGLGTLLVSLAPSISNNPELAKFLQQISPTVTLIGAYLSKVIVDRVRTYYMLQGAKKLNEQIDKYLENDDASASHVRNLRKKREEIQLRTLDLMEKNLLNSEDYGASKSPNKQRQSDA